MINGKLMMNRAQYFVNMAETPISLKTLLIARKKLIKIISKTLSNNEKNFILSVKKGSPNYSLMLFDNLKSLSALKWKVMNIQRMNKDKHQIMLKNLIDVLEN